MCIIWPNNIPAPRFDSVSVGFQRFIFFHWRYRHCNIYLLHIPCLCSLHVSVLHFGAQQLVSDNAFLHILCSYTILQTSLSLQASLILGQNNVAQSDFSVFYYLLLVQHNWLSCSRALLIVNNLIYLLCLAASTNKNPALHLKLPSLLLSCSSEHAASLKWRFFSA
jgi:hypothetical protein